LAHPEALHWEHYLGIFLSSAPTTAADPQCAELATDEGPTPKLTARGRAAFSRAFRSHAVLDAHGHVVAWRHSEFELVRDGAVDLALEAQKFGDIGDDMSARRCRLLSRAVLDPSDPRHFEAIGTIRRLRIRKLIARDALAELLRQPGLRDEDLLDMCWAFREGIDNLGLSRESTGPVPADAHAIVEQIVMGDPTALESYLPIVDREYLRWSSTRERAILADEDDSDLEIRR
jgi:hypothetical protein